MGSIIEDELFSSSIIKDLHVLDFDYVPSELPHRAEQLKKLAQMFKPVFVNIAPRWRNISVSPLFISHENKAGYSNTFISIVENDPPMRWSSLVF
jgi:Cdc6-like AAA superfamily ATPase